VILCRRINAINASSVSLLPRERILAITCDRFAGEKTSDIDMVHRFNVTEQETLHWREVHPGIEVLSVSAIDVPFRDNEEAFCFVGVRSAKPNDVADTDHRSLNKLHAACGLFDGWRGDAIAQTTPLRVGGVEFVVGKLTPLGSSPSLDHDRL